MFLERYIAFIRCIHKSTNDIPIYSIKGAANDILTRYGNCKKDVIAHAIVTSAKALLISTANERVYDSQFYSSATRF